MNSVKNRTARGGMSKAVALAVVLVLSIAVADGCSDSGHRGRLVQPVTPPSIPSLTVGQLLDAPESLTVDGTRLKTEVYLSRDFFGGPPGYPLAAFAIFGGAPPDTFPASISGVYVWAIRDSSEVWSTTMQFLVIDWSRGGAHAYRGGGYGTDAPNWDPGTYADVVIGLRTSPTSVTLGLFRHVLITASY